MTFPPDTSSATRLLRTFSRAAHGSVAMWAAFALPTMTVGAALTVDVSRLQALDNDLQSAADALAKAGAAELDQTPSSMTRAEAAVNNLLRNSMRAGAGVRSDVPVAEIRFLKDLPSPRWSENTDDVRTYSPSEARYVEVRVDPKTVGTLFPVSLSGKFADVTLSARATAGLDLGVCDSAPVFICNPFEGSSLTFAEAASTKSFQRRELTLVSGSGGSGGNGAYSPGNFGWLDPFANNSGASVLVDAIARDKTGMCFSKSAGVYLRPGKIASMRFGVNTRFDIYEGKFKQMSDDPIYAPAANVVKGYSVWQQKGGKKKGRWVRKDACDAAPSPHTMALPGDSGTDSLLGDRVGNGDWDYYAYMQRNHPGLPPLTIEGVTYTLDHVNKTHDQPHPPSRYAMYRWEIDNNCVPGSLTYGNHVATLEEGLPQCNTHTSKDPDRRVISVAVINCQAVQDSGISMSGRAGPIPVEGFARVFLTQPMGKPGKGDNVLRGEVVGMVDPRTDSRSRDRVALVR